MNKDHTTKRYVFVTLLNVIITIAEFLGGIFSGSLALLSDAVHNLSDVGAIILSFIAHLISRRSRNNNKTFGYERAETLAAFTNGVVLIVISVVLFVEAIQRFWEPEHIHGGIMLVVSIIGLLANIISMLAMHRDAKGNLNVRSTFIHMLSDALSSVAVVIGAVFIYFWNVTWLDPVLTILVSLFVLHEAYEITMKECQLGMFPKMNTSVTLSGLALSGKILLPVRKSETQVKNEIEASNNRKQLLNAARSGDQTAMESLTLDDIDTYSKVSRRLVSEDIFTIVDTYFMPYGVECDMYSILGEILAMRERKNSLTGEEVYQMKLNVNELQFDICVPKAQVLGEPQIGRRFKGTIWLQGMINF